MTDAARTPALHSALGVLVLCGLAALVLSGLVSLVAAGPAVGATPADASVAGHGGPGQPTLANNSTVQHVDPDAANQRGNLSGTSAWLRTRIAQRIGQSSIELSQGQYDRADDLVDEDTRELLGRYVDVAGETGAGGGGGGGGGGGDQDLEDVETETTETLDETTRQQRRFVNATREFNRGFRNYTAAREAGNAAQARRIARRLNVLAANVTRTGQNLQRNYTVLASLTGANLTRANVSVANVIENVTERQRRVRVASFNETTLTILAADRQFAFDSPLTVRARLAIRNGSAIANRRVRVAVGGARDGTSTNKLVSTNATGVFTLRYRPVRFPTGRSQLVLRYRPRLTSPYLGSNDTAPADVSAVEPNVSVTVNRATLRYRDRFNVTGRVAVANVSVPRAPVVVRVGSYRVGRVGTNANGRFAISGRLPATVDAGPRQVVARIAMRDRAIAATAGAHPIPVRERETRLNLTLGGGTTLTATGILTTASGVPVPRRQVAIYVDGQRIATGRTNARGQYAIPVNKSAVFDGAGDVAVVARYAESGTNLAPSRARRTLSSGSGGFSVGGIPFVLLLVGVVGSVSIVGGGLWIRRRDTSAESQPDATTQAYATTPEDDTPDAAEVARTLLARARDRLDEGEATAAIELAYAAARKDLDPERRHGTATHWEFARAVSDTLTADQQTLLEGLTADYEAAIYAETADRATAESALSTVSDLLEERADTRQDEQPADS